MKKQKQISFNEYYDRVYGGWIGKCIGGTIGAAAEGEKFLHDYTYETAFPEQIPPNDDLDLQILWLQVMEQKGPAVTGEDLADAWMKHCWYPFNEYGNFKRNYACGIRPPASGSFNNEYFETGMGCPIRSEIWGFVYPGAPGTAAKHARTDGTLDHSDESTCSEMMFSAIESELFTCSPDGEFMKELDKLILKYMKHLPRKSRLRKSIMSVYESRREGLDWQAARKRLQLGFSTCEPCDVYPNIPLTVLSLVYGEGDFGKTMLIALNSGYDTDCTCATAGAILGVILGAGRIPGEWKGRIEDCFVIGIDVKRPDDRISTLSHDTCRAGIECLESITGGLRVTGVPDSIRSEIRGLQKGRAKHSPVNCSVSYSGTPSLSPGDTRKATLTFRNTSGKPVPCDLKVSSPAHIKTDRDKLSFKLAKNSSRKVSLSVSVPGTVNTMPQKNIIRLGGKGAGCSFGFSGAQLWQVLGIFWEDWEKDRHGSGYSRDFGWRHNVVEIDREYINETEWNYAACLRESAKLLGQARNVLRAHTSVLPVNDVIRFTGEYCIYLLCNFVLKDGPKRLNLIIGSNNPYKLWVNEKPAGKYDKTTIWTPFNSVQDAEFCRGTNRIVLKLLCVTDRLKASVLYREYEGGTKHNYNRMQPFTDFSTSLYRG